jgi:hypothetical protein
MYFYLSTFRSMCAVPNMAVFCSSLTSWLLGMMLKYFMNYLEMIPVAPIITGITLVFTFHIRCISIVRSLYFKIFSTSFWITFLSSEIATSVSMHVPFSLSRVTMSGLLLGMVVSVCTCWFYSMVTLPPRFVSIDFGTCSYSVFCLTVPMFRCICWSAAVHSVYHVVLYTVILLLKRKSINIEINF